MALLGNGTVLNKCPIRFLAGSASSTQTGLRATWQRNGMERNRFYIDQNTTAIPTWSEPAASYPPYCYTLLPQRGSFISSRRETWATFAATAEGLRGMPGAGSATFAITTNAPDGELITSADGSASFAITTNAPLLTASINGAGSSSFAVTANTPILGAIADLTAAATFGVATNTPIIFPLNDASPLRSGNAAFAVTGTLQRYAVGHMTGSALPYTELSPQSLASAVWDSILAEFQRDGSAGKALSTAGAGGVDLTALSDAVVTALEAATIPVNTVAIKGQPILGSGTEADPWGP